MKCPACAAPDSRVIDSRPFDDGKSIKRRRECNSCGRRFNTYEVIETAPVVVVKKDGTKEFFDRHKLETGILRACYKREVNVPEIVTAIETELTNSLAGEVTAGEIGEMVMDKLREADAVSYVRFASVYRQFKDADTLLSELEQLIRRK